MTKNRGFTPKFMHELWNYALNNNINNTKEGDFFTRTNVKYGTSNISDYFHNLLLEVNLKTFKNKLLNEFGPQALNTIIDNEVIYELLKSTNNSYAYLYNDCEDYVEEYETMLKSQKNILLNASVKEPRNYIVSKNLSDILCNIPPILKNRDIIFEMTQEHSVYSIRYNLIEIDLLKNISIYAYSHCGRIDFCVFANLNTTNGFYHASGFLLKGERAKQLGFSYFLEEKDCIDKHKPLKLTGYSIHTLVYNTLLYIENPTKNTLVCNKIAEFSKKKGKRNYEMKHYCNETWKELDICSPNVRAYEQGKVWERKAHTRWQPYGKGRSKVKLVFIQPQQVTRKKML